MSVYNGAVYLREAVDSILIQTFADFEFIIVDDGSTDETPSILASYADPRIVRLRNDTNIGLTKSLNRGLAVARGEYVARQDADDVSLPTRLEKQVDFLDNHPEVALVGSWFLTIDADRRQQKTVRVPTSDSELQDRLIYEDPLCHGSVMFRRASLDKVDSYCEELRFAQDWDLWLRMSEHFRMSAIPEILYVFRRHSGAVSHTSFRGQQLCVSKAIRDAIERRQSRSVSCATSQKSLARCYFNLSLNHLMEGEGTEARACLRKAAQFNDIFTCDMQYVLRTLVYRAVAISRTLEGKRLNPKIGTGYIESFFASIPVLLDCEDHKRRALGWFHAAAAFEHYWSGDWVEVVKHSVVAIANDYRWLSNLGLLSISVRSAIRGTLCLKSV